MTENRQEPIITEHETRVIRVGSNQVFNENTGGPLVAGIYRMETLRQLTLITQLEEDD